MAETEQARVEVGPQQIQGILDASLAIRAQSLHRQRLGLAPGLPTDLLAVTGIGVLVLSSILRLLRLTVKLR